MTGTLLMLSIVILLLLVAVAAVTPARPSVSAFELNRRKRAGSSTELDDVRALLYADVISIQRVVQAILLVVFVLLIVAALGWFWGSVISVIVALEYGALARLPIIKRFSQHFYERYEHSLLSFFKRQQRFIRWLRCVIPPAETTRIDSKDELLHIIENSPNVLTDDQKQAIRSNLEFDHRLVRDIMTPKSVVETIKKSEILGPLVLDDLHKTGHSRFPVIDGDIDHVVGILHVKNVLTLDTRRAHTAKAESAMNKQVCYIRDDHSLAQALSAFLSTHQHMFIVINEFRETVGIITLEDTIEALLGRKIIDEFDAHDDMRAVAARQAASKRSINRPPHAKDV